ncbi:MAG TPA: S1 RNA-binding domain-containing protein, partial [Thiotrichales bacterium]|nr:S1 RNA-binding domain-containing protein [Thiotrichales bacterium]
MSEEILVNVTPQETRVAMVENGVLQEVLIERARSRGLVGNIYKGVVCRVLPGMQAAFIDAGLERAAFLHASDIAQPNDEEAAEDRNNITRLLREGQEVLVQVIKDPLGTKGARLTTHITIPSRYLVLMPGGGNVGVSQKIEDEEERQRLRDVVLAHAANGHGYIVRTAAEGVSAEALAADMAFLDKLWASIMERAREARPGTIVHEDLPLVSRVLRDLVGIEVEKVRIDSRETFQRLQEFAEKFVPEVRDKLEYYPGERPVFDLYGVE